MSRTVFALLVLLAAAPAPAQIQSRPTDPPLVTAVNESWYQLGEPIQFAGDLYYRAGASVFFDGNIMVRSGHYNGVPLYMDATIEPYSVVLVPIRRGLMQPYERRRSGDLAGTTASRTPSFPVRATPDAYRPPQAAAAPTQLQVPIGAIAAYTPATTPAVVREVPAVGTLDTQAAGRGAPASRPEGPPMTSLRQPESNDGLWIRYNGEKWVSAGAAVPLRASEFRAVGQYAGFPVFARPDASGTIYLPTRAGLIAPYARR